MLGTLENTPSTPIHPVTQNLFDQQFQQAQASNSWSAPAAATSSLATTIHSSLVSSSLLPMSQDKAELSRHSVAELASSSRERLAGRDKGNKGRGRGEHMPKLSKQSSDTSIVPSLTTTKPGHKKGPKIKGEFFGDSISRPTNTLVVKTKSKVRPYKSMGSPTGSQPGPTAANTIKKGPNSTTTSTAQGTGHLFKVDPDQANTSTPAHPATAPLTQTQPPISSTPAPPAHKKPSKLKKKHSHHSSFSGDSQPSHQTTSTQKSHSSHTYPSSSTTSHPHPSTSSQKHRKPSTNNNSHISQPPPPSRSSPPPHPPPPPFHFTQSPLLPLKKVSSNSNPSSHTHSLPPHLENNSSSHHHSLSLVEKERERSTEYGASQLAQVPTDRMRSFGTEKVRTASLGRPVSQEQAPTPSALPGDKVERKKKKKPKKEKEREKEREHTRQTTKKTAKMELQTSEFSKSTILNQQQQQPVPLAGSNVSAVTPVQHPQQTVLPSSMPVTSQDHVISHVRPKPRLEKLQQPSTLATE